MADANKANKAAETTKTIAVKVTDQLHRDVKLAAAVTGQSVSDLVTGLLQGRVAGIKVTDSGS